MKPRQTEKTPHDEMQYRINYEQEYLDLCARSNREVDFDRLRMNLAHALECGIIKGSRGKGYVFEMPALTHRGYKFSVMITDREFIVLLDALINRNPDRKGCTEEVTLSFANNELTDDGLGALGRVIKHNRFPREVTIDLSQSNGFTNAGATQLLAALQDERCNPSVNIVLPENPRLINQELLQKIRDQLKQNHARYQAEKEKPKPKQPMRRKLFTHDDVKVTENEEKSAARIAAPKKKETTKRRSLFSRKTTAVKASDTRKTEYRKLNK